MTVVTAVRAGEPFTYADLETMPDDGRRYEIVDGVLIVTPAPTPLHQRAVKRLSRLLDDACPADLEVFFAPFDIVLADDTVLEPDVLVARRADLTGRHLPTAPVLAVEVLSPSTRRVDLTLKRARFEAAGALSYWVVDALAPSVRVWELRDGTYIEAAHVDGGTEWTACRPFAVTIDPAALVSDY